MVPGGTQVLPGGCRVVIAHKMNVLESLGKVVFGPLTPRGGLGDPPPILGTKLASLSKEGGFGGILPPILGRNWTLARGLEVGWACPAHLYLIECNQTSDHI